MFPRNTPRLLLRDVTRADQQNILTIVSDAENTRHLIWGPANSRMVRDYLRRADYENLSRNPRRRWVLAFIHHETEAFVGFGYVELIVTTQRLLKMGCMIHRNYWQGGYGGEMVVEYFRFGFEDLLVDRVIATCAPGNQASIRTFQKFGMACEGTIHDAVTHHELTRDSLMFSIENPARAMFHEEVLPHDAPIAV